MNPFLLYAIGYVFFQKILLGLGMITPEAASYLWTGLILLGVAPCIAMVLVWTDLAKGNGPLGIVLMAWNSIIQVITTPFYIALLVGTYIAIDIVLIGQSVFLYLGLPLLFGVICYGHRASCEGAGTDQPRECFALAQDEVVRWKKRQYVRSHIAKI